VGSDLGAVAVDAAGEVSTTHSAAGGVAAVAGGAVDHAEVYSAYEAAAADAPRPLDAAVANVAVPRTCFLNIGREP
jgi:hypothetical protein